jgi:hypothetical protein
MTSAIQAMNRFVRSALPLIADAGRALSVSSGLTRFALPGHGAYASMNGVIEVLRSTCRRNRAHAASPRQTISVARMENCGLHDERSCRGLAGMFLAWLWT